MARNNKKSKQTKEPEAVIPNVQSPEVAVFAMSGKFKLVHPNRFYLDVPTGKSYTGDGVFESKNLSRYERANLAETKEKALSWGKIFYKV